MGFLLVGGPTYSGETVSLNFLSAKMAAVLLLTVTSSISFGTAHEAAASAGCSSPWGSLPKEGTFVDSSGEFRTRVVNVRSGRHECFDRLVIDLDEIPTGYDVQYVDESTALSMGLDQPLRGDAIIDITVTGMDGAADRGDEPFDPSDSSEAVDVDGYRTFRQAAYSGPFEDKDRVWLGLKARLPFRVFTLSGPGDGSRLVVDVAHRWFTQKKVGLFFSTGDGTDCSEVTGFPRGADGVPAPIGYTLAQLVEGPTVIEQHMGASSFFSEDTSGSIRSINLKSDGLLIVDFKDIRSAIPGASSSCGSEALLSSLNSTAFQFSAVARVRYQIDGSCDTFFEWLQRDCTEIRR